MKLTHIMQLSKCETKYQMLLTIFLSISHDHHDTTMIKEYEDTNTAVFNGYELITFTSTLSKKGDLVNIISQQKHLGSSEKNELLTTLQHHKE